MTAAPPVAFSDVQDAAARLDGIAHRTPVLTSRTLDALVGAEVFVKCENFQRVGAFKFRGAYNAASRLPAGQLARGIAAYSSGNHAQAVALAARELGTTAVVLMPEDAPRAKREATAGYGAEIVTYDRYTQDRTALGEALAEERGLALIPPYDHPHVIAGQGTAALELLEETGALDALVVPVGGGGLVAGSATAAKALHPGIRVVGVEPEAGDDTKRSLDRGERVTVPSPHHRRRTGPAHPRRDHLRRQPAPGRRDRPRRRRRDRRGHALRLRTPEDRSRTERRHRPGRAHGRTPGTPPAPGRRHRLGRERRREAVRGVDRSLNAGRFAEQVGRRGAAVTERGTPGRSLPRGSRTPGPRRGRSRRCSPPPRAGRAVHREP